MRLLGARVRRPLKRPLPCRMGVAFHGRGRTHRGFPRRWIPRPFVVIVDRERPVAPELADLAVNRSAALS